MKHNNFGHTVGIDTWIKIVKMTMVKHRLLANPTKPTFSVGVSLTTFTLEAFSSNILIRTLEQHLNNCRLNVYIVEIKKLLTQLD